MKYAQIREFDVANGPGIRTSVFVTGCNLKCPGCFNEKYSDFNYGRPWTQVESDRIIKFLAHPHVCGLSVLGGEPLLQDEQINELLQLVKAKSQKNIWLWTGFYYEQLNLKQLQILEFVDVLVDGPFEIAKKNLKLRFRGSTNQRIIDLNSTRRFNKLVLLPGYDEEIG